MTKDDFAERCAEVDHVWERLTGICIQMSMPAKNCLTYARRDGAAMTTIMCAKPGCSSPAEMYMEPEARWVCIRFTSPRLHFVAEAIRSRTSRRHAASTSVTIRKTVAAESDMSHISSH